MTKPNLLAFAGSTRAGSWNKKMINAVAARAEALGATVTVIDLADYPMPIYDGDLEDKSGLPDNALKLQSLMSSHDGFLISTPEYNAFFPAVLKNALDWVSRPSPHQEGLASFRNKPVGLFAASPGRLGGIRALNQLRTQMSELGGVIPSGGVSLAQAHDAFDDSGAFVNEAVEQMVDGAIRSTLSVLDQSQSSG